MFRNDFDYNLMRLNALQGKIASVWAGDFYFNGVRSYPVLPFNYLTSNFTDFEKHINPDTRMIYHLSGYGATYDEALRGFLGESAERYSFAVLSQFVENRMVKRSFRSLLDEFGAESVFPLECINVYCKEGDSDYVEESDDIYWVRMNSLVSPNEPFYAPLQLVISGGSVVFPEEKKYSLSAVSTGTACHETIVQAMDNAIIECLQIDCFELWWYGGFEGKAVSIDMRAFLERHFNSDYVKQFLDSFSISFTDISFDKCIYVYVCEIVGKRPGLPKYTVGVQGGYDEQKTLYRCLMEALSVLEYNMGLPWMDYERWSGVTESIKNIMNFDDNVIKYAKYGKPEMNMRESGFAPAPKQKSVLRFVQENYPRSGYLVITAPEFQDSNLEVVRVCIPNLLTLSLPSYPPIYHPRFKSGDGIKNYAAHPLA